MKNQSRNSSELKKASAALFVMGGVSSLAIMTGLKSIAVPAAALFTAAGGALLIADAVINPENVKIPDIPEVKIPEIKIPTINV
jgi:hypothetical protein